jgi:DNA-binding transcriptional LysR family regulator
MELRQLEHFVAVAEEGHFNAAASRCHIVRSGLSASIRVLERELETSLFVRTTHEVRLTPAGLALLGEARRVLASVDAARDAVEGVAGLVRGTLRVAVSHANRAADVPAALATFRQAYPDVAISLTAGVWRDILADVRTGATDVGLVYLPADVPPGTHFEPVASGSPVMVCAYDHHLAARSEVQLGDLQGETIIAVHPAGVWRSALDQALEAAGLAQRSGIEVTRLGMLLALVRAGIGLGIMPGPDAGGTSAELARKSDIDIGSARNGRAPVCYVPIVGPSPRWTYAVVTPPPELRTPAAKAFLGLLAEQRGAGAVHPDARSAEGGLLLQRR